MLTPAGAECPYYYEDFARGRSTQECRLIARNPHSDPWQPKLCSACEVPAILRANGCTHMVLQGRVVRRWLGLVQRVEVYAVCSRNQIEVKDPYVGCGYCHSSAPSILNARVVEEE